jgi:hypothetical protein
MEAVRVDSIFGWVTEPIRNAFPARPISNGGTYSPRGICKWFYQNVHDSDYAELVV